MSRHWAGCVGVIIIVASFAALAGPAGAYIAYPWCSTGAGMDFGGRNCGFATFAQCLATASGNGQMCEPNPFYTAPAAAPVRAVKKRSRRR